MEVLWLNDSIVIRAENKEEKQALALIYKGVAPAKGHEEQHELTTTH
jgi:hypothetical protein